MRERGRTGRAADLLDRETNAPSLGALPSTFAPRCTQLCREVNEARGETGALRRAARTATPGLSAPATAMEDAPVVEIIAEVIMRG